MSKSKFSMPTKSRAERRGLLKGVSTAASSSLQKGQKENLVLKRFYGEASTGVRSMIDGENAVIAAIKQFDPQTGSDWDQLKTMIHNPTFVAIDPVINTIGIERSGRFSGLANVLIKVVGKGFRGKQVESSLSIPALVDGMLISDRTAKVSNMRLRAKVSNMRLRLSPESLGINEADQRYGTVHAAE